MRRAANPLPSGRPVKKRAVDHEEFTWIVPGPDRPSHRVLERSPRLEQWPEHVLGGTFQEYKSMSPYHIWCNQDAFVRYSFAQLRTASHWPEFLRSHWVPSGFR